MISSSDQFNEYRLPGDEQPKEPKWERERFDDTVHIRRGKPQPTSLPYDPYHDSGPYQYGKRPKGWKK